MNMEVEHKELGMVQYDPQYENIMDGTMIMECGAISLVINILKTYLSMIGYSNKASLYKVPLTSRMDL